MVRTYVMEYMHGNQLRRTEFVTEDVQAANDAVYEQEAK